MNDPATCPRLYHVRVTWVLAGGTSRAAGLGLDEAVEVRAESAQDACADAVDAAEYRGHLDGVDPARFRPLAEVMARE